jgi:hypothetical protein
MLPIISTSSTHYNYILATNKKIHINEGTNNRRSADVPWQTVEHTKQLFRVSDTGQNLLPLFGRPGVSPLLPVMMVSNSANGQDLTMSNNNGFPILSPMVSRAIIDCIDSLADGRTRCPPSRPCCVPSRPNRFGLGLGYLVE